jgi:GT2 family glycosyltransferase
MRPTPPIERATISVIVPTIGRPDSLKRLLNSLAEQTTKVSEVIVADGSESDATVMLLYGAQWAKAGLTIHHLRVTPPNAVRQRETAIAKSQGDFLLLLDDDVVLDSTCVQHLLRELQTDRDVVATCADFSNTSWPEPTRAWRLYLKICHQLAEGDWSGRVIGPLLRFGFHPVPTEPRPMEWIGTCNTMVRRSAFLACGGFSNFFLHRCTINEDVDLGLKLGRIGKILFCPAARLAHYHAPSGRVTPRVAAEDDIYNRFLILRHTLGYSPLKAFALAGAYVAVETFSNFLGCVYRLRFAAFSDRFLGRTGALGRIVSSHFLSQRRTSPGGSIRAIK